MGHFSLYLLISLVFIQPLPAGSTVIKTYCCNSHHLPFLSDTWALESERKTWLFCFPWLVTTCRAMMANKETLEREDKVDQMYEHWIVFCFVGLPIEVHPKEIEYCLKGERLLRSKVECLVDTIFLWGSFWRKVAVTKNAFSKYNGALLLSISRFDITPFKTHKVLHNWTGTEVFDRI